jgi:hypothetical protein
MVAMIVNLPENILIYIRSLLCRLPWNYEKMDEYELHLTEDRGEELQENFYWIHFMNTTKLFQQLKRKTIYLSLSFKSSEKYLTNEVFYNRVNEKLIFSPVTQLNLNINSLLEFLDKHELQIKAAIAGVHCLRINSYTGKFSLSQLAENAKILRIHRCNARSLTEISSITNTETLQISNCPALKTFELENTFQKLYLHGCTSLTDITSLENCSQLKLLYLSSCPQLRKGYSIFSKLDEVYLFFQELPKLEDYSYLSTVRKISIESDNKITANEMTKYLQTVEDLSLIRCARLSSFGQVPKLKMVYVDECPNLLKIDFESLPALTTMFLVDNIGIKNIFVAETNYSKLSKLVLNGCKNVQRIEIKTPTLRRFALLDMTTYDAKGRPNQIICSIRNAHPSIKIANTIVILC